MTITPPSPGRNGRPPVNSRELSYALALRAIGQSLEANEIKDFDLSAVETGFVVHETQPRYLKWRRTFLSNENGKILNLSDLHFSVDDIARLDQSGKERRETPGQTPNFHILSQTLRTVGGLIDRRGLRLLELNRRGAKLTLELEPAGEQRLVETHTMGSLHNIFVGMFFNRQRKKFDDNGDSRK